MARLAEVLEGNRVAVAMEAGLLGKEGAKMVEAALATEVVEERGVGGMVALARMVEGAAAVRMVQQEGRRGRRWLASRGRPRARARA